jgi:hypothetical protein
VAQHPRAAREGLAAVASVEPSSITSSSTESKPSRERGRSAIVAGSVSSSFRQGIWMINFKAATRVRGVEVEAWPR